MGRLYWNRQTSCLFPLNGFWLKSADTMPDSMHSDMKTLNQSSLSILVTLETLKFAETFQNHYRKNSLSTIKFLLNVAFSGYIFV